MRLLGSIGLALLGAAGLVYFLSAEVDEWKDLERRLRTITLEPTPHIHAEMLTSTTPEPVSTVRASFFGLERMPAERPTAMPFRYEYSSSFLASLHPQLHSMAIRQKDYDFANAAHAPMLDYDGDVGKDSKGRIVPFTLSSVIARTKTSTVFGVNEFPNLVVKYQVNCEWLGKIHPLARDFWFMQALDGTGIVPKTLFLSPPVKFENRTNTKTDFRMMEAKRDACERDPRSSVRYLVMERISGTVYDLISQWRDAPVPFETAVLFGIKLLQALRVMHQKGIVHGDIHAGNVGITQREDGNSYITLIDFGHADLAEYPEARPARVREPWTHVHHSFGIYELDGYESSYRDDVYRAIEIVAILLNGPAYYDFITGLDRDHARLRKFKLHDFIFSNMVPGIDPFAALTTTESNKAEILLCFKRLLQLARNLDKTDKALAHDDIIKELQRAYDFAPAAGQVISGNVSISSIPHPPP